MSSKDSKSTICRKVLTFMFSHIGLCGMVILYCVAGGFIFEHLEKNNEQQICYESRDEYTKMENKTLVNLIKIANTAKRDYILDEFKKILETFRNNSVNIGYDGRACNLYGKVGGPSFQWSWPGALMFSVTVVSTIGYGHIAPKTVWGRLVCIAYSVLGIPLMLLCLANIGDALADVFRFAYAKICCCGCCRKKPSKTTILHIKPTNPQGGDGQNDTGGKALPAIKMDRSSDFDPDTKRLGSSGKRSRPTTPITKSVKIYPIDKNIGFPKTEPIVVDDDSEDEDDDFDEKNITVPLTVTMIVIAGYIFGGAVLFSLWESWDWLQSAYFCFITLSTIGFGDVVPGTDFDNPQAQVQLILGAFYSLFGMAILSMCFALMQEEMASKFKWIGEKMGLVEKDE